MISKSNRKLTNYHLSTVYSKFKFIYFDQETPHANNHNVIGSLEYVQEIQNIKGGV